MRGSEKAKANGKEAAAAAKTALVTLYSRLLADHRRHHLPVAFIVVEQSHSVTEWTSKPQSLPHNHTEVWQVMVVVVVVVVPHVRRPL